MFKALDIGSSVLWISFKGFLEIFLETRVKNS